MSAYGKPPQPQIHGYETNRTYPDNSFAYTPPVYGSQPVVPPSTSAPGYQNATQLTPMAYSSNQVRTPYDEQAGPYLNVGSTSPEVTSFSPSQGTWNTKIYVQITSLYELLTTPPPSFFLMFGHRKVQASVQRHNQAGGVCTYRLLADAPQFAATGWASCNVPLCMFMESVEGDMMGMGKVNVGEFTYTDSDSSSSGKSPQDGSRKRKLSVDSADLLKSPDSKRNSNQQIRPKEEYPNYQFPANDPPAYSPYGQPTNSYNMAQSYSRPISSYQGQPPARHIYNNYAASGTESPTVGKPQSPQVGNWNYSVVSSNSNRNPGIPTNPAPRPSLSSLPSADVANPPLVRTSCITQSPSPTTTPQGGNPQYNNYAMYSHKAKLEIAGDLDSMALHWTQEEFESRRRLVQFNRTQAHSTITTTFAPISVDERQPNSICISCIYWEEKEECFVTSVDTIYLLEQLVAARFTVEEKNRIRRNLEGFRPLTVSKGKSESEEFFKVIMGFPAPKPRNIEKDVKVFHWKDLASALKKIIGKYSASPSSTLPPQAPAAALMTPVSSTGYSTENSAAGIASSSYAAGGAAGDHNNHNHSQHTTSPPNSAYNNAVPVPVGSGGIPTRVLSPHVNPNDRINITINSQQPHQDVRDWSASQRHAQNVNQNHLHLPQAQYQQHLGSGGSGGGGGSGAGNQRSWNDMPDSNYMENPHAHSPITNTAPQHHHARSAEDNRHHQQQQQQKQARNLSGQGAQGHGHGQQMPRS